MTRSYPRWARWRARTVPYTVGVEEEVMLLDPNSWALRQESGAVMAACSAELAGHLTPETHGCALELATGVHDTVGGALGELRELRHRLAGEIGAMGLRAGAAGTHPEAIWRDTLVSSGERYQFLYGSMRELARREPTFALHVHVGVPDPERAVVLLNRLRAHLPLLLALSSNSPFWQGRDTGLASARTPLFGAFPRTGIPRDFDGYGEWVGVVDLLVRTEALPDFTYLWWDVRLQPQLGTVEVRIMDAQTTVDETAAMVALVQSLARLELEGEHHGDHLLGAPEVLGENRFLAARDGMEARLIDRESQQRIPARELLGELVAACAPHARALGCERELGWVAALGDQPDAARQLAIARGQLDLRHLSAALSDAFLAAAARPPARL